jgi:hypothetical protein
MIIYETEQQVVYRGIDRTTVNYILPYLTDTKKLVVVYATVEEFMKCNFESTSSYFARYACPDEVSNDWIIQRQKSLETPIEWKPSAGIKIGLI